MSEIITGLRIHNFLPFRGVHELELTAGAFAIVAEHDDDPRRSNWSGKTSFLYAIRFVLTGDHPKRTEDGWITDGEDEGGVDLEFSGGTFASRTRTRGGSTQLVVILPEQDGTERELRGEQAQAALDRLTATTKDEALATWWSEQKNVDWFVTSDPGEVTAQIAEWCGIEKVRQAAALVADDLNRLQKEKDGYLAVGDAAGKDAINIDVEPPGEREKLQARADDLTIRLEKDAGARAALAQSEARARDANAYAQLGLVIANEEKNEPEQFAEVDREVAQKERDALTAKTQTLDWERLEKKKLAQGKFGGVCPVGGIECPVTAQLNANLEANAHALVLAQRKFDEVDRKRADASKQLAVILEAERAGSRWSANLEGLRRRQDLLRPAWELHQKASAPETTSGEDFGRELTRVREHILKLDRDDAMRIAYKKRATESLASAKQLTPEITARLEALLILGPAGAQRRVAERMLSIIELRANELLQRSGVDLSITFQWARETQQPAEHCAACGLPFPSSRKVKACTSCGAQRGQKLEHKFRAVISPSSGGAEDLAGLAVRLAANAWLRSMRGSAWRVACIDEPASALDQHNRNAVGRTLVAMLSDEFGVEQSFVTAHDAGMLSMFPNVIRIVRGENGSRVEVVK